MEKIKIQNIDYIDIENCKSQENKDLTKISLTSYNILADYYVQFYDKYLISTSKDYIKIENRSKIIIETIKKIDSDIFFLQEVDYFEELYKNSFEELGYKYLIKQKLNKGDSVVIMFKSSVFELVKSDFLELKPKNEFEDNIVYKKGIVAICVELVHKESNKKIILLNTHLSSDPREEHVKYIQICLIISYLEKNFSSNDVIIWGGDLNSLQKDNNLQYALNKSSPDPKLIDFYDDIIIEEELMLYEHFSKQERKIKWANLYYNYGGKDNSLPKFTNYAADFVGTIDHIFYNSNKVFPVKLLKIDEEEIVKEKSIPRNEFPSDHVPISGVFLI